jgi:hypothetical protein
MPIRGACAEQFDAPPFGDDHAEFVEVPECRNRSGRGALTGVLLGAGMWAVILAATGVIKL